MYTAGDEDDLVLWKSQYEFSEAIGNELTLTSKSDWESMMPARFAVRVVKMFEGSSTRNSRIVAMPRLDCWSLQADLLPRSEAAPSHQPHAHDIWTTHHDRDDHLEFLVFVPIIVPPVYLHHPRREARSRASSLHPADPTPDEINHPTMQLRIRIAGHPLYRITTNHALDIAEVRLEP